MTRLTESSPPTMVLTALSLSSGCGYHTVGSASHLPANVHTIAVKFIENKTQRYHSEIVGFDKALVPGLSCPCLCG